MDPATRDVQLAVTKYHLRRICVIQPGDGAASSTVVVPDNYRGSAPPADSPLRAQFGQFQAATDRFLDPAFAAAKT